MFLKMPFWEDAKAPKVDLFFQEKTQVKGCYVSLQPLGFSIEQKIYQNFNILNHPWPPKI